MPGIVDTHVHINEPGRTEWEGFETATRAAAAGGVTTLVDMPLNSIPATTTVEGFTAKRRAAEGRCHVDVGFWGGVVPGNVRDLEPLARAGVLGFKCFLSPSGVDEFPNVSEQDLRLAMPIVASNTVCHCWRTRNGLLCSSSPSATMTRGCIDVAANAASGRRAGGDRSLDRPGRPCRRAPAHRPPGLGRRAAAIGKARAPGVTMTVETCPHYLTFCAEEIAAGATAWKCAPPIRERDHRERLWQALARWRD